LKDIEKEERNREMRGQKRQNTKDLLSAADGFDREKTQA
jgi:hypothetical protein